MSIRVLYFAGLREAIGVASEIVSPPPEVVTVGALRDWLAARHPALAVTKNLRCAVNQTMSGLDAPIAAGDEVAFFPPVTGG